MRRNAAILLTLLALLLCVSSSSAQGGYGVSWWTVDGGGYTYSSGEGYTLVGTIGQPDAGALMGGPYGLSGGFWARAIPVRGVYLPLVMRH
jgi:hypothetical protein